MFVFIYSFLLKLYVSKLMEWIQNVDFTGNDSDYLIDCQNVEHVSI